MTASTAPKSRFKYAATLLGAFAILALAPATANAVPVDQTPGGGGGCTYTDKDGYPIPIDDGQAVIVDGKTVSCSGGTITTTPAKKNVGNIRVPVIKNAPVFSARP